METLKLCITTQQYGNIVSGVGTYATNLIDELNKKGHEVTVVCPNNNFIKKKKEMITFLQVDKWNNDPTPNNWFSLSYNFAKKINSTKNDFDIIHFTDARESLFHSKNYIPVVGTQHDFYSADAKKNPLYYKQYFGDWIKRYFYYNINNILEQKALGKLDEIIAVCRFTSNQINKSYRIPKKNLHTVYNGIYYDKYAINKRKSHADPIILFIGGNFKRKGLPSIIRSSPEVIREIPTVKFYIIGKDPDTNHLQELCKKLGVEKNFIFLGYVSDDEIFHYLSIADVFIMPSLFESFAFVFLEAMASGIPVIGGKTGGATELIIHNTNGFIVDPHDYKKISKYILILLHNKDVWKKMSENCKKTVEDFSLEKMVNNTIEVYKLAMLKEPY